MGGKIKTGRDAPAKRGGILRPVAAGWQKWGENASGIVTLQAEAPELTELKPSENDLIAVPVRRAFSICLWIPADDPSVFRDLVFTHLEMRGLAGRTPGDTVFALREIVREQNEALVQITLLPSHLSSRYWHGDVTNYTVSPTCLPLEQDAVTIWREEGAWVAAITRGDKLLHFQTLSEPAVDGAMLLEVRTMLSALEAGAMIEGQPRVFFYRQDGEALDLASWNESSTFAAKVGDFPAPVRPAESSGCVPLAVRDLQLQKNKNAQRQRLAFGGAAVYLALVLLLAAQTLWLHWQARRLQAEIDRDAPAVAATKAAMDKWQALQPSLEPSTYPLEVLFQVSRLLPKDGVRLTLFEMNLDHVLIQGEASTLAAALKFEDDLKKNQDLEPLYDWSAEGPKQLPSGSTRFQIDGTRRGSAAQATNESPNL